MYKGRGVGRATVRTRIQGWKRLLKECAVWKPEHGPMCELIIKLIKCGGLIAKK